MIDSLHLLRPWWLFALIPLLGLMVMVWNKKTRLDSWSEICDAHLLAHLIQGEKGKNAFYSLRTIFFSLFWLIIGLSGPAWYQLPVAIYKPVQPRMIVLDMSSPMLATDLSPNRLSRAKFKLRDLFMQKELGQVGLIVYTGESFVVSPLTDDGQTIVSLLSALTPDIIPVSGHKLDLALSDAAKMIEQAGYQQGHILVLTANSPSVQAIAKANVLAQRGIYSSIMPVLATKDLNPLFSRFAQAGEGELISYRTDSSDLMHWISTTDTKRFAKNNDDGVPLWQDEGRWFLGLALFFLLPVFQRGWLQRLMS